MRACCGLAGSVSMPARRLVRGRWRPRRLCATHFGAAAAAIWLECGGVAAAGQGVGAGGRSRGAVAGLVGITPGGRALCHRSMRLWIGLITGVFCYLMVVKVKQIFGYGRFARRVWRARRGRGRWERC